jgi:hypothetical protein
VDFLLEYQGQFTLETQMAQWRADLDMPSALMNY